MLVENGRVALFAYHCHRVMADAHRLQIPLTRDALEQQISEQARTLGQGVLKLLVSAGEGGRGYHRPPTVTATLHFSSSAVPAAYAEQRQSGIAVIFARLQLALQPALAGIKHLNRLEQVLIKQEVSAAGADDAIVCDAYGNLVEASAANLFWQQDNTWFTPDMSACGVSGVMRAFLLDWFAAQGIPVEVGSYQPDTLATARAVFVCNALMPMLPVRTLRGSQSTVHYELSPVQALYQSIQPAYKEAYATVN